MSTGLYFLQTLVALILTQARFQWLNVFLYKNRSRSLTNLYFISYFLYIYLSKCLICFTSIFYLVLNLNSLPESPYVHLKQSEFYSRHNVISKASLKPSPKKCKYVLKQYHVFKQFWNIFTYNFVWYSAYSVVTLYKC